MIVTKVKMHYNRLIASYIQYVYVMCVCVQRHICIYTHTLSL